MSSEATPDTSDKSHINSAKPHKTTKTAKPRKTANAPIEPLQPTSKQLGDKPAATAIIDTPQTGQTGQGTTAGDVAISEAATAADGPAVANLPREESQASATRRWRSAGIAEQVAVYRDRKREEYRERHPKAKRRDAHEYAWACAVAEFPPPGVAPVAVEEPATCPPMVDIELECPPMVDTAPQPTASTNDVPGLGTLPDSWPQLPANASLQAEISWVSANRLRVRDGKGVDLSRALSPPPSYSALSWLETSILFPSKFADISVKATQNQEDEAQHIRREKLAIEEIRALLAEMMEE